MPDRDLQPLDAATWLASLVRLRRQMERSDYPVENGLRLAFLLSRLAPHPYAALFRADLSEARFEQLAESGVPEATAIALLGDGVSFELERNPSEATVCARIWIDDVCGEARKPHSAAALSQAWLDFLICRVGRDCDQSGSDSHSPA